MISNHVGAKIIAIAASHSPLIRKADVALIVDHVEDVTTHLPMVRRILHLLAIGVAMGRNPGTAGLMSGEADERLDEATPASKRPAARNQAPGVVWHHLWQN
nr:hypothetical protein [uncultured Undibacterium sp.]